MIKHFLILLPLLSVGVFAQESAKETGLGAQGRKIDFWTDEATLMNVDISPDGEWVLFDILGDIYTVSINGGEATRIRSGEPWDSHPQYSPDGKLIAFISDGGDSYPALWLMNSDGSQVRTLSTRPISNKRSVAIPIWHPSGREILIREESGYVAYPIGGADSHEFAILPTDQNVIDVAYSPSGRHLYITGNHVGRFDVSSGKIEQLTTAYVGHDSYVRPRASPDGSWLAYINQRPDGESTRLLNLSTGTDRELFRLNRSDDREVGWPQTYTFMPDSSAILIAISGKIRTIDIQSGRFETIPFRGHIEQIIAAPVRVRSSVARNNSISVKNIRWHSSLMGSDEIVFGALGKIWRAKISETTNEVAERITKRPNREYMPSISPNGSNLAYVEWTDRNLGHIMVIEGGTGYAKSLTKVPGFYVNPTWSPDGEEIAYLKGSRNQIWKSFDHHFPNFDLEILGLKSRAVRKIASVPVAHYKFRHQYSPLTWIGSRIYFVENDNEQNCIVSVDVNDLEQTKHLSFDWRVDYAIPSPDGKHIAVSDRTTVWVFDLLESAKNEGKVEIVNPPPGGKLVSDAGGSYLNWVDAKTLRIGFLNHVYEWKLGEGTTKKFDIGLSVPRAQPERPLAFTNARIITMNGDEVIKRSTIIVDKGRVAEIGRVRNVKIPNRVDVVDLRGKTIIPGIIDTHSHLHGTNQVIVPEFKPEYVASLAYGITTIFDPSAPTLDVFLQGEMVNAGELLGPRIYSSGEAINGLDLYPSYFNIDDVEDARAIVSHLKESGAIMLKSYTQERRDQRRWLVQAAREQGVRITVEGARELTLHLTYVADGHTAAEHAYWFHPLHEDVIQYLAQSGVHITPVISSLVGNERGADELYCMNYYPEDNKLRRFTPQKTLSKFQTWTCRKEPLFRQVAVDLAKLVRAGGKVDTGNHGQLPGLGTHYETWLLTLGGFTNHEALRAATLSGAEKLGLEDDLGSLEVGKLADFIVLNSNPLDDIRSTADIKYVVKGGFVYDAESMTELYPEYKPLPKPGWQSDEDWEEYKSPLPEPLFH
jgi:imidazolonepropionase-like amidohydrolase/Tol biopolymer transport system component